ncbi:MAG: Carbohydrate binding domain (family 25) [Firmicutes bacterium]|nr:Carbohydrate binding domain (family 25) [Bacillota bacterium]
MPRIKKSTSDADLNETTPTSSTTTRKPRRSSIEATALTPTHESKSTRAQRIETDDSSAPKTVRKYKAKGVLLSLEVSPVYSPVRISYEGLLAQSGATELYAHAGIGSSWDNSQEVKMTKTSSGLFEATVLAAEESTLNVCFRDAMFNWDNNSNANYVFNVT